MNRILSLLCTALLSVVALSGCATRNPHKVMEQKGDHAPIPVRAAVVDFQDNRQTSQYFNQTWTMVPIIGLWGGYYLDKHDAIYSSATEPFPKVMAKELTNRLKETNVFQQVDYVDGTPKDGDYDVIVSGKINRMRAQGAQTRYGLSILGDLLWEIGLPYLSRSWDVDVEYTLKDAYTGEPLTKQPEVAKFTTTRMIFTKYYSRGKVNDLKRKLVPAQDQFISSVWKNQPAPTSTVWADLKSNGKNLIAKRVAEADQMKKGTAPTFNFTSPTDGSTVRESVAKVAWSVSAPGGVKTVDLYVDDRPVGLDFSTEFLNPSSAMNKGIPPQEVVVPLSRLGTHVIRGRVTDHRGNAPAESRLTLNRLPKALNPEKRYALLIGAGTQPAQESVTGLQSVLSDPTIGQFEQGSITKLTDSKLSGEAIRAALKEFGRRPIAGDLVLIYLATNGDWTSLKIGDGTMTFDDFVKELKASVSTENVILLADIDWQGNSAEAINSRLSNLPRSWAVLTPNAEGGASPKSGNSLAFASAVVSVLKGSGSQDRLTLERFADQVISALSGASAKPEVYGRYNPSLTLAERE